MEVCLGIGWQKEESTESTKMRKERMGGDLSEGWAECRETLKWKTMRKGQGRGWDSNEAEKDPGEQ